MPGTEVEKQRQVRSYHQAYSGELTLYSFGNDLRPWRPIAARQIFWTGGLFVIAFLFARASGLSLPVWSMGWFLYYFLIPGGLGWLFSRAIVEGRRLHVVVASWVRHALYGRHLAGGYRRVGRNQQAFRATKIRVESAYRPRQPVHVTRKAASALAGVVLIPLAIGVVAGPSKPRVATHRVLAAHLPVVLAPPVAATVHRPVHPRVVVKRHRRPTAPKHVRVRRTRTVRPATARRVASPRRRAVAPSSPVRAVAPPAPVVTTPAPVVTQPAPVVTHTVVTTSSPTPDPSPSPAPAPTPKPDPAPPCYPGQLGCDG